MKTILESLDPQRKVGLGAVVVTEKCEKQRHRVDITRWCEADRQGSAVQKNGGVKMRRQRWDFVKRWYDGECATAVGDAECCQCGGNC